MPPLGTHKVHLQDTKSISPQRTDYAPPEVYRRRAGEGRNMERQHGDRFFPEVQWIEVVYDSSFNLFVANTAHALRHRLFYRTDGGRFARGLVRDSGDLEKIHDYFNNSAALPTGRKVRLRAVIVRRKDRAPHEQWEITVRFALPVAEYADEGDVITVDPKVHAESLERHQKYLTSYVLYEGGIIAREITAKNRNIGDRISKIMSIADRLGYPAYLQLWHYQPYLVGIYLALGTTNEQRRRMTSVTGGKTAFDGHSATQAGGWRKYPFREILKEITGKDEKTRRAIIHNTLVETDRRLFELIEKANRAANQNGTGGGDAWGPLASKFFDHLKAMQGDPKNLLHPYAQQGQGAKDGIWSTY